MNRMMLGRREIGTGHPTYIIAELSANHGQSLELSVRSLKAMKAAGADAVKIQTYTADTMTIPSCRAPFVIGGGTLWDGRTLHELYREAHLPWEWHFQLQQVATELGMDFFSTPFDASAVEFLEGLNVPVHKVASFEIVDLPLLRRIAGTRKPIIMSTGMALPEEIEEALATLDAAGSGPVALLKCTSAYPAPAEEMNLRTIPDLRSRYGRIVGLSDHTLGTSVAVAAVTLGATIIEKHFTLARANGGPDAAFSLEPAEFREMVDAIRTVEKALGEVSYQISANERRSRIFRRSLFVVQNMRAGERFTAENVRCIRPAHGLHPRHLDQVLGATATQDIEAGTPLEWLLVTGARVQ